MHLHSSVFITDIISIKLWWPKTMSNTVVCITECEQSSHLVNEPQWRPPMKPSRLLRITMVN